MPMSSKFYRLATKLTSLEIWVIAPLVGGCLMTQRLFPWTLLIAILFWAIRWIATGTPTISTPVDISVLALLFMLPITFWVTDLPDKTYLQAARLIISILFLYSIINWTNTNQRLSLVVLAIVLAGLGLSLFALVSVEWQVEKLYFISAAVYERFSILVSDTSQSNVMGGNLAIIAPYALAMLLFAGHQLPLWEKITYAFITLFLLGVLILTQSRGALIGLISIVPLLIALRWKRGWIMFPVLALMGTIILWQWNLRQVLDAASANVKIGGIEGRIEIWSRGIYMIQDFPFTGIGMGTFTQVANLLYPFFSFGDWQVPHSHNLLLQVAIDVGIPGLIAWFSIYLIVLFLAWQIYQHGRASENNWACGFGAAVISSQTLMLVHGIVDAVTWGVRPEPILWALWGVTIAAWRIIVLPRLASATSEASPN